MTNHRIGFSFLAFLVLNAQAAFADPVTYSGKLGNIDIVVEFTDDPAAPHGPLGGRYFYLSKGVDIPLNAKSDKKGRIELSEEEACGAEKCGDGRAAPIAATWRLDVKDGGKTLTGAWNAKKSLPLKLQRVASRPQPDNYDATPLGLFTFSDQTFYPDGEKITEQNSPYDYLRFQAPLEQGKKEGWPDAAFNYVVDPRTKFPSPRILELAGDTPIEPANALLTQQHMMDSRNALACAALQYRGFHDDAPLSTMDDGTLGGFDEISAKVDWLSPGLMSWTQSGSVYCGGAHPSNFTFYNNIDLRTGAELGLADIFRDAADGKAGGSLVAFVKQTRQKPTSQVDIDFEQECGTEDLIAEYLAVRFERTDKERRVIFGLSGLPHVINACGDDLISMPIEQAKDQFKPEFWQTLTK